MTFDINAAQAKAAQIEQEVIDRYERTGGSAFPWTEQGPGGETSNGDAGMTLRDWFAGQALAGEMAAQNGTTGTYGTDAPSDFLEKRAAFLYRYADAMLAARKEG